LSCEVWQMNIRRLTPADLVELGTVICASSGCAHDAHWEVAKEVRAYPTQGLGRFKLFDFTAICMPEHSAWKLL